MESVYDKYLDEEIRRHFTIKHQYNPREWVIIHLIYDNKPLEQAPFDISNIDKEFYEQMKKDFAEHRKHNKNFYYAYLSDID